MNKVYEFLGVKNFEQAVQKSEVILAEVFIHGKATKYNDTQIELANDIIYRRDELSFNESIEEHYDEPIQEVYDRVYK